MTVLSEDLVLLLEAERDIDVPAVAERERMFERLAPLLVVPVTLAAAGAVASASSTSAATATADVAGAVLGGAIKAKIVAAIGAAALIGGAVGATGHAYLSSPPAPAAVAPAALPTPGATKPVPPAHEEPAAVAAPAPAPTAAPPLGASPETRPRAASSLRAERLLIEAASAALLRGDAQSAILALRQHGRQFPKGDLAEEREVLLVKALAASGDDTAAEKRARDFERKFPDSMQQRPVDDTGRSR